MQRSSLDNSSDPNSSSSPKSQGAYAFGRVGLLGNPSDIYGGRGLGFTCANFPVQVSLAEDRGLQIEGDLQTTLGKALPNDLFRAGWTLFCSSLAQQSALAKLTEAPAFQLSFRSKVPLQSGLSGSSALLIAALRAWCGWYSAELDALQQAELAWRAENEELQLRAGPLDRLVQAFGGLLWMDFAKPFEPQSIQRLPSNLLPPICLAWDPKPGAPSGDVHAPIYERHQAGDPSVNKVMGHLAQNAERGRAALELRQHEAFAETINRNFDLRSQLFPISDRDRQLIEIGRAHGCATKFCGSGGSSLAVLPPSMAPNSSDSSTTHSLIKSYRAAGFEAVMAEPQSIPY